MNMAKHIINESAIGFILAHEIKALVVLAEKPKASLHCALFVFIML